MNQSHENESPSMDCTEHRTDRKSVQQTDLHSYTDTHTLASKKGLPNNRWVDDERHPAGKRKGNTIFR